MAKEYVRDNYLISFIANSTDMRIHCYNRDDHRAYEKVQTSEDYAIYTKIGINIFCIIKQALDDGDYIIKSKRTMSITFKKEPIKMKILLDNIRTETLDLSVLAVRSELATLRDEYEGKMEEYEAKISELSRYITIGNYSVNQCKEELICLNKYAHATTPILYPKLGTYKPLSDYYYGLGIYHYTGSVNNHVPIKTETDHHDKAIPYTVYSDVVDCEDIILLKNIKKLVFMNVTILNIEMLLNREYEELHFYNATCKLSTIKIASLLAKFTSLKQLHIICTSGDFRAVDYSFTRSLTKLTNITISTTESADGIRNSITIAKK